MNLIFSQHSIKRIKNRSISKEVIDYIINEGTQLKRAGNCTAYFLKKHEIDSKLKMKGSKRLQVISSTPVKNEIEILKKAEGVAILISDDNGSIITAMHIQKRWRAQ